MQALAGTILTPEGWLDGHVQIEAGKIVEVARGPSPVEPRARGVIVPAFTNAHTHLGDAVARGAALPATLAEAVRPPHGYKHRVLAATPAPILVEALRGAAREVFDSGAAAVLDFREGGPAGVAQWRSGVAGVGLRAWALGRPASMDFTAKEAEEIARLADGIGLSSLPDYGADRARVLADAARRAGKPFALHASEESREPMTPVLDLRPDLVVHLTFATRSDLEAARDARVAVAVCPRSNARWVKRVPDVRAMLDLGLDVGLGTDNAMLGTADVLEEARALRSLVPSITPGEVLRMLCFGARRLVLPAQEPLAEGAPAHLLVFPRRGPSPAAAVLAAGAVPIHREGAIS